MMQGVRALGAALINTVFSKGFNVISLKIFKYIKSCSVFTTSDDSVRGLTLKGNKTDR